VPERAVSYDEAYVRWAFAAAGFIIDESIDYGGWARRRLTRGEGYQDFEYATEPR